MNRSHRPKHWATETLTALCVSATLLAYAPGIPFRLGQAATNDVVRMMSAPFVHGFTVGSAILHLVGNVVLLLVAGRAIEPVLGSLRLVALTLAALAVYAVIQALAHFEVNGASVFIWAYGPPLALLGRRGEARSGGTDPRVIVVLAVMWAIVPVLMTAVPYASGWHGSLVGAFLVANTFHISATAVGGLMTWVWRACLRAGHKGGPNR